MFCDLLLARFGLLTQMKELDSGIAEQVSSLIWVAPRLQSDVQELKGLVSIKFCIKLNLLSGSFLSCLSHFGAIDVQVWQTVRGGCSNRIRRALCVRKADAQAGRSGAS